MKKDDKFELAKEYLKKRLVLRGQLREKQVQKSVEEKLEDIFELKKFLSKK